MKKALKTVKSNLLLSSHTTDLVEAGVDEVGRGCLAGPVVAASVILPKNYQNPILNDSKKLNHVVRKALTAQLKKDAVAYAIGEISHTIIDEVNILNATYLAMHQSIEALRVTPELLLIDGNRFKPYKSIPYECIVKGDGKYLSIAAASVLAKTYRDELMEKLDIEFPHYGWAKNVGYPTVKHRAGIQEFGVTPYHRKSFKLLPTQLELF